MIISVNDIPVAYENCDVTECKTCPLNMYVDLIPAEKNYGMAVRGTVCDLITALNQYNVRKISQLLK